MKKFTIIGGGISGLTARYVLSKRFPDAEIILHEKSGRLGGVIESLQSPFFFETGPRTIKASRSPELLELIDALGLNDQILMSSKEAKKRFIFKEGTLRSLPSLLPPLIPALLKEWQQPYPWEGDETIASFVKRRLGTYALETFFDPLTLGIFAGDTRTLSISACFPELKAMEKEYGSLTKAFFKREKKKGPKGLLSLKGGLQTLIDALAKQGRGGIHLQSSLEAFPEGETVLAVPTNAAAVFFKGDPAAESFFAGTPSASLTVINFAFEGKKKIPEGFGYLVPTKEEESILGVVFDSSIFPEQNQRGEIRLTVMMREGTKDEALSTLKRHLGITEAPKKVHCTHYPHAVPQYGVDHLERVAAFESHLKMHYPHVTCIGNYLRGVSLNACVKQTLALGCRKSNGEPSYT